MVMDMVMVMVMVMVTNLTPNFSLHHPPKDRLKAQHNGNPPAITTRNHHPEIDPLTLSTI